MANTKDYSMREMILDQCLSSGKEFMREALQAAVNKALLQRGMQAVTSKVTILKDLDEMNEKFYRMYEVYGIVSEKRGRFHYYRYRDGIESIYNRELTADEIEKLQEVRSLLQGLRGMPQLEWVDQMSARFDQQIMGQTRTVASIYPYYLKQYLRRWYLFATIKDHDFVTCFSLDRIVSARENNDEAYRETTIGFNHYFDDIVGVTHPDGGVVEHVVIEGDSWAEHYLTTLPIHPLQQLERLDEGGCRVTMDVMLNPELEREILSYGEHLRVKAPESLRRRMALLHFFQCVCSG